MAQKINYLEKENDRITSENKYLYEENGRNATTNQPFDRQIKEIYVQMQYLCLKNPKLE